MNAPNSDEMDVQDTGRLAAGREAALDELMERHAEKLFHYLFRSLQNEEDAADLAQETFVKVYQSRTLRSESEIFDLALRHREQLGAGPLPLALPASAGLA